METTVFKIKYLLQDSGDIETLDDGTTRPLRMEIQNDPKYLLAILNGVDTAKEPFKARRRTIMRIFAAISKVARSWAKQMRTENIPDDQEIFELEADIPVSPEGMEFLKELVDNPPEGIRYSTIPVQHLLVAIADQYDDWRKESGDGGKAVTPESVS